MSSLTPYADMGPVPRVEVVVDPADLIASTDTVTFRRRAEGRTFFVRGGVSRPAATTVVAMDYEAPFHTESVYEAMCFDAAGVYMGTSQLDSVTLEYDGTVIQQPMNPKLSVEVKRLIATAANIARPTPGELVYTENQGLGKLIGLGPRRGVVDLELDLLVSSHEAADALQATLGTYEVPQLQVWLVRTPPPMRIPRVLFCSVPQLNELEVNNHLGLSDVRFGATVAEVLPPAPGLSPAVLRYPDVGAVFADYSDVGAVYTLYSDIARDQSLVGAAG